MSIGKSGIKLLCAVTMVGVMLVAGFTILLATAPAFAQKTIELKYSHPYPKTDEMFIGPNYMFEELQKRTNGRVKVTPYFSETLGRLADSLDMLNKGIADIVLVNPDLFSKQFPLLTATLIAALGSPNRPITQEATYTLYCTGLLKKDLTGFKPLLFEATDAAGLGLKKKVTTLEELRKMKIRTPPGSFTKSMQAMEVPVVSVPAPEVYMALERGVVDGTVTMPGSFVSQRHYEKAKYWLLYPMGVGVNMILMTQEKWDSLPLDIQLIWEEINEEAKYVYLEEMDRLVPDRLAQLKSLGVETYTLSPEEHARWVKLMSPVLEKYMADFEAAGYPARKAVEAIKRAINRFKQ
jgi:TRAP-type C4-dicarboxylate transport system substrate-binding protein